MDNIASAKLPRKAILPEFPVSSARVYMVCFYFVCYCLSESQCFHALSGQMWNSIGPLADISGAHKLAKTSFSLRTNCT